MRGAGLLGKRIVHRRRGGGRAGAFAQPAVLLRQC